MAAARACGNLSALFNWAMGEGLCESNPVLATNNIRAGQTAPSQTALGTARGSTWCGNSNSIRVALSWSL